MCKKSLGVVAYGGEFSNPFRSFKTEISYLLRYFWQNDWSYICLQKTFSKSVDKALKQKILEEYAGDFRRSFYGYHFF